MIKTNNPEIDVDDIMDRVREEVARRRGSTSSLHSTQNIPYARKQKSSSYWQKVSSNLNTAEEYTDVGTKNLPMVEFPRWIRWLARLAGRIVLYFTLVISVPQRRFNRNILEALRTMLDDIWDLHHGVAGHTAKISQLESLINDLTHVYQLHRLNSWYTANFYVFVRRHALFRALYDGPEHLLMKER